MAKKLTTIYLDIEQLERLNKLSSMTKTTKSEYIREAFDLVLKKYENELNRKPPTKARKHSVKSEQQEKRGFFRVLTNFKGHYALNDKNKKISWEKCTIINIHHKGFGFEFFTPKKIKVGSALLFEISPSDKAEPITIKGKIKWIKERKRYFIGGIAVTFKRDEDKLATLIRLILGIKRERR